jgi:hypothetical protein
MWKLQKETDINLRLYNLSPNVTIEWVTLWLHVLEVLGSSLVPETGCLD